MRGGGRAAREGTHECCEVAQPAVQARSRRVECRARRCGAVGSGWTRRLEAGLDGEERLEGRLVRGLCLHARLAQDGLRSLAGSGGEGGGRRGGPAATKPSRASLGSLKVCVSRLEPTLTAYRVEKAAGPARKSELGRGVLALALDLTVVALSAACCSYRLLRGSRRTSAICLAELRVEKDTEREDAPFQSTDRLLD